MKWFWLFLFSFLLILILLLGIFRPEAIDSTLAFMALWFTALLWVLFALALIGGLFVFGTLIYKAYLRNMTQIDGSYPIQRIRLGNGRTALVAPDNWVGPGIVIDRRRGTIEELNPAAGWQTQATIRGMVQATRTAQAIWPGDPTRRNKFGAMNRPPSITAGAARLLDGSKQPKQLPTVDAEPMPMPEPVTPPVRDAADAMRYSEQQAWVVGQSPTTGEIISFNPALHAHAGIIGSTGTGKTTSVGFLLVAQALRHGCHVVILDPEGGQDWRQFSRVAEWHEVDRETFPAQVESVYREFDRRTDGNYAQQRVVVVLEEYGDIIAQLRMVDRAQANSVDAMLDMILRRGRKRNISLVFIDQYPEHWSPQVNGGTKFKTVFQLGPNQGAKVQEYHAAQLSPRGAFLVRNHEYRTWPAERMLPDLLRSAPPLNGYRVIDAEPVFGNSSAPNATEQPPNTVYQRETNTERTEQREEVDAITPPFDPPFDVRSHPKRDVVLWYLDNVGGTQAECRRWAEERGLSLSKGYVSDIYNGRYADAEPGDRVTIDIEPELDDVPPLRRMLAELKEPIYVNGQRLGVDPSITVRPGE